MMASWMWPWRSESSRIAQQRGDAFVGRLADAHQHPGGERDLQLAGLAVHAQAQGGLLVRRGVVRPALLAEAIAHGLEHQPHRRVPRPQLRHLLLREQTGVGVREHSLRHRDATRLDEVLRGARVALRGEPLAVARERQLRLVAQAEERFGAACARGVRADARRPPRACTTSRPGRPVASRRCSRCSGRGTGW